MAYRYGEPSVDELITDDTARALMSRDGVDEHALRELITRVAGAPSADRPFPPRSPFRPTRSEISPLSGLCRVSGRSLASIGRC